MFLENRIEMRDAVLNSALNEFIKNGYSDSSINRIARDSGFSKQLILHYVGSKKELFLWVMQYMANILKECYEQIDVRDKDLFNRIEKLVLNQVELISKYPRLLLLDTLFKKEKDVEVIDDLNKIKICSESEIQEKLTKDINLDLFKEDAKPDVTINIIFFSVNGYLNSVKNKIELNLSFNLSKEVSKFKMYIETLKKLIYK